MTNTKQTSAAAIAKLCESIKRRGKVLDNDIQNAGLKTIEHVELYNDASVANNLLAALPQGSRKNALVEWFLQHGKLRLNPTEDKDERKKSPLSWDKHATTKLDLAKVTPWYTCKPEKDIHDEFDLNARLNSLFKGFNKAVAKGDTIKGDDEVQALFKELMAKVQMAENDKAKSEA